MNRECPTCEGAGWDWKRCADEDQQVDDPVDYYWCQRCDGTGKVTPENVEPPSYDPKSGVHTTGRCRAMGCTCNAAPPPPENVDSPTWSPCDPSTWEHPPWDEPENVECRTCGGMVWVNRLDPHSSPISCPDCTPENVEEPTVHQCCGCSCDVCAEGHNSIRPPRRHTTECFMRFDAATPENVEEPT